ncbi:glycosyltransferase family A protein [Bacillus mobilis]|uniref:glycosyltransferase family 2 protein n=1 Tax=Bacillus mobilis TaxID=2026190 RepID=UPI002FDBE9B9
MKLSLVMATIGRIEDIKFLMESLNKQKYKNFELIVVDQNKHDKVKELVNEYQKFFTIKYIKSSPGLSKARNMGLKIAEGDIIGFPDDDCWYNENTLQNVVDFFEDNTGYQLVTGMCKDSAGNVSVSKFSEEPCNIDKQNVWTCGVSVTLFIRKEIIFKIRGFDEELGAGAGTIFGSGEETDFILNALKVGFKGYYTPEIIVFHENPLMEYNEKSYRRAYSYGAGYLKVLKKHEYSPLKKALALFKPVVGMLIYCLKVSKMKYYYYLFKGRFIGYLKG